MGEDGIVLREPGDVSDPSVTGPLLARAHRRAAYSDHQVPSPDGCLPVVFAGAAAGVLIHELVGHLLEADIIASGGTVLADRLGSYVCKMPLTIVDDPTLSGRWGSFTYDDEGRLASPTPLLVDGVVCGVLTDRTRGPVAGAIYSGHNARRASVQYVPLPRMSNVSMFAGTDRLGDVISDLDNAVYCDELTRGQVDPVTGHFALNMISGRAIRSGRLGEYLGPAILTGDVLEVLSSIRAVCDDSDDIQTLCGKAGQQVLVEMNAPSLFVGALEIRRS
ncbi:TldD/PmbA family protein [Actinomyces ruminicola]|uniref:TldD/PmbA family protein n=1 Tax=Actinomyces ruminicola TaxID=332524 RepID=UPI0021C48A96|nr:TldD/PmbA family protein [Actinomyces ruminicola]